MSNSIPLDYAVEKLIRVGKGNPGAISVLTEMMRRAPEIVLHLETLNIVGSRIWMLYKDVCKEDIAKTILLVYANKIGIISKESLDKAIDNYGEGLDVEETVKQVEKELVKELVEKMSI